MEPAATAAFSALTHAVGSLLVSGVDAGYCADQAITEECSSLKLGQESGYTYRVSRLGGIGRHRLVDPV
jgi:hypothetical protein